MITGADGNYIIIHLNLKLITKAKQRKENLSLLKQCVPCCCLSVPDQIERSNYE